MTDQPDMALPIVMHGTGRMAGALVEALENSEDFCIAATVGPVAPGWGLDAKHYFTLDELPTLPVLLIDFSLPDGTRAAAKWCAEEGVAMLSGVTGLPASVEKALQSAAATVPVLWSPNLSLGVNLMAALAGQAAAALGPETPVAIEDIHHQWKRDAPSGTALMLGEAINSRWQDEGEVKYSSIRKGDAVGVHTISFRLAGEEIELVHRAYNRSIYALGALSAGKWLMDQSAGLYTAADWLAGRISDSG
jgi:4-hydroxy-tetrahydrodipicolinate reductase